MTETKLEIVSLLEKHKVTMKASFVPFSRSPNKDQKHPSLNYIVTVYKGDREILTTTYMMGSGHCPSYKQMDNSIDTRDLVKWECENGKKGSIIGGMAPRPAVQHKPILPELADVLHSLLMDGEAIDRSGFEEWAGDYGYDTDSRSAEKIYRACVDTGLKLRYALGDAALVELREAFQDY